MRPADLADTGRLLELHAQAVAAGLPYAGEGGRHDFVALAERARAHGKRPGALFAYLVRNRKTLFITLADEDAASRRLKEHLHGPQGLGRERWGGAEEGAGTGSSRAGTMPELTADEKVVLACLRVAKRHRGADPFRLAQQAKGWTRDRWDATLDVYERKDRERWGRGNEDAETWWNR